MLKINNIITRDSSGSKNGRALLNDQDIKDIINDTLNGKYNCIQDICNKYKLQYQSIYKIIVGKSWIKVINQFSQNDKMRKHKNQEARIHAGLKVYDMLHT